LDLLNTSYPQPGPGASKLNNTSVRASVGNNASLLSHKQTFEMYLANVKKTDEPAVLYEFAVFMLNSMREMPAVDLEDSTSITRARLMRESKSILQRLADRSYPFAQYYLADGYASGLFNKGKPDQDRAFSLFIAASKHGHVEACYRTALCYEFGWGCRADGGRAVQFYRQAASKNHPGAMMRMANACLAGDMGLGKRYREGIKWMKRATESSDAQYNAAPYELGLMHETGYGDDVFIDESYAAQLFTKAAELGHQEAAYRLGDAYEHGKLTCPRDPALSIHFYTSAAQTGHPLAMMALCAWYLVGAEPVLEKDENEAYEWASKAAELGTYRLALIECSSRRLTIKTKQASQRQNMLLATSLKWASDVDVTPSRRTSGTSRPPIKVMSVRSTALLPFELQPTVRTRSMRLDTAGSERIKTKVSPL
jgi:TPR repeat protein